MSDIRLDSFVDVGGSPVDPKLFAVLTPEHVFETGSWHKAAATIQNFPSTGTWTLDVFDKEVVVADSNGTTICRLQSLYAGTPEQKGEALITYGGLPYSAARWHLQD